MSESKCYNCGKDIPTEDLVMKDVSTGTYGSSRKPFHSACYKIYRSYRRKKEFIEYTTLADGIFLMLACVFVYASRDIVSLAFLGSTIAIAIGIGYAWFKLEK